MWRLVWRDGVSRGGKERTIERIRSTGLLCVVGLSGWSSELPCDRPNGNSRAAEIDARQSSAKSTTSNLLDG